MNCLPSYQVPDGDKLPVVKVSAHRALLNGEAQVGSHSVDELMAKPWTNTFRFRNVSSTSRS